MKSKTLFVMLFSVLIYSNLCQATTPSAYGTYSYRDVCYSVNPLPSMHKFDLFIRNFHSNYSVESVTGSVTSLEGFHLSGFGEECRYVRFVNKSQTTYQFKTDKSCKNPISVSLKMTDSNSGSAEIKIGTKYEQYAYIKCEERE